MIGLIYMVYLLSVIRNFRFLNYFQIRRNDPYFKLKDGSFIIIPEPFFAKFESIKYAKSDGTSIGDYPSNIFHWSTK